MVLTVERHEGGVALVTLSPEAAKNTFTKSNFEYLYIFIITSIIF